MLILGEQEELSNALIARMDTTSNTIQKFEIVNILLKWGNDKAVHHAADIVLSNFYNFAPSKELRMKTLKDVYHYGNKSKRRKAHALFLREFRDSAVDFSKRLDIAKTVLEFGTETRKDAMQRELIALAHGLGLDGVDQILSLLH